MMNQSTKDFVLKLENVSINIKASSSPAGYLAHYMAKDKAWGEKKLEALKRGAARARNDLADYRGLQGEALFNRAMEKQTLGMSESEKKEAAAKVRKMITEQGYQMDDVGKPLRIKGEEQKEMLACCKQAAKFFARNNGETDDEALLTAFYIASEASRGDEDARQAEAIGYCVGLACEAARQARKNNPMLSYDALFTDDETTAIFFWVLMVAAIVISIFVLKVPAMVVAMLYVPVVIALLAAAFALTESMSEGKIHQAIETHVIARKSFAASKAVIQENVLQTEDVSDDQAERTYCAYDDSESTVTA